MSFTAQYSVSQSVNGNSLIINDTSSYASEPKSSFTSRRLTLLKVDGTPINFPSGSTTGYIDFSFAAYPSDSITITGFTGDLALIVTMTLVSSAPVTGSTYTISSVVPMIGYTMLSIYNATQIAATNPIRLSDNQFYDTLSQLQTEVDNATVAGTYGDQFSAQAALDRAALVISQENLRF
jgi:hypothetical protein